MTLKNCRIDRIRGCYVDENREIVTELHETFLALEESTVEKYCEIFRQTLGGKPGKNLFNLEFPLEEEAPGGRQDMLNRLLQSGLEDKALVRAFFDKVIETAASMISPGALRTELIWKTPLTMSILLSCAVSAPSFF